MYIVDDEVFINEIIKLIEEFSKKQTDYIFKYDLKRLLDEYKRELVADTEEHLCAFCGLRQNKEFYN